MPNRRMSTPLANPSEKTIHSNPIAMSMFNRRMVTPLDREKVGILGDLDAKRQQEFHQLQQKTGKPLPYNPFETKFVKKHNLEPEVKEVTDKGYNPAVYDAWSRIWLTDANQSKARAKNVKPKSEYTPEPKLANAVDDFSRAFPYMRKIDGMPTKDLLEQMAIFESSYGQDKEAKSNKYRTPNLQMGKTAVWEAAQSMSPKVKKYLENKGIHIPLRDEVDSGVMSKQEYYNMVRELVKEHPELEVALAYAYMNRYANRGK
jgi:hypothetical protein